MGMIRSTVRRFGLPISAAYALFRNYRRRPATNVAQTPSNALDASYQRTFSPEQPHHLTASNFPQIHPRRRTRLPTCTQHLVGTITCPSARVCRPQIHSRPPPRFRIVTRSPPQKYTSQPYRQPPQCANSTARDTVSSPYKYLFETAPTEHTRRKHTFKKLHAHTLRRPCVCNNAPVGNSREPMRLNHRQHAHSSFSHAPRA